METERRGRVARAGDTAHEFVRGVYEKAAEDNIFFMSGAIAFNVLVAFLPLILAVLGIAGTILRFQEAGAAGPLWDYLIRSVPPYFRDELRGALRDLVEQSAGLLGIGTIILVWLATRLVGTLRTALREVFDVQRDDRGIVRGKVFDTRMVFTAGTLFALNIGLTVAVEVVAQYGVQILGLSPGQLPGAKFFYGQVVAFLTVWAMFLLIYRYLPPRRTGWNTSITAATFTALIFEAMKLGFSWYVTNVANYEMLYGGVATLILLFLWIYYSAVVFILGGEIAQVTAMRRTRRRQKERLR